MSLQTAVDEASMKALVDMWLEAGKYVGAQTIQYTSYDAGDKTTPFILCDERLTLSEALYALSFAMLCRSQMTDKDAQFVQYQGKAIFPVCFCQDTTHTIANTFQMMPKVRKLVLWTKGKGFGEKSDYFAVSDANRSFPSCLMLEEIDGFMDVSKATSESNYPWFNFCDNLREVRIKGVRFSYSRINVPKLSHASLAYLVANSANGASPITVTVHAGVWDALHGDAQYPFNGADRQQWQQLMADAAERNIAFAMG